MNLSDLSARHSGGSHGPYNFLGSFDCEPD